MISKNNELLQGKFFLNIAIHVTILFSILSILFIYYITHLTSNLLNGHFTGIINKYFKDNTNNLKNYIKTNNLPFNNYINNFDYNYYEKVYSKQDLTRKLINEQVINKIINVNILLVIITILYCITLLLTNNISYGDIKDLIIENIISFSIIGVIEYLFFTNIAFKFVPSPPSHILKSLLANLKN